jgi:small-conductance mechanosensitive channel
MHKALPFLAVLLPQLHALQVATGPPSPPPEPVPLTQIAAKGDDLGRVLRDIERQLPLASELADFDAKLGEQEKEVQRTLEESTELLAGSATIMEIQEQVRQYRAYGLPEAQLRKTLASWGAVCEQNIRILKNHEAVWQATLKSTPTLDELQSVRARVRQFVDEIGAVETVAVERLRTVVELQGRVSRQASSIAEMLEKLSDATKSFQIRLFFPDAPPLWKLWSGGPKAESLRSVLRRSWARSGSHTVGFLRSSPGLVIGMILSMALALAGGRWLRRAIRRSQSSDALLLGSAEILRRPVSLAVLAAAPAVFATLPLARMSVVLLGLQIFLIPLARLLPLVGNWSRRTAWSLAAFYGLHGLIWMLDSESAAARQLITALFILTMAVLARSKRLDSPLVRASIVALSLILLANILGFLLLSNLLRVSAVLASYMGLVVYTFARVASILLTAALRLPRFAGLATLRLRGPQVLFWIKWTVGVCAAFWWVYSVIDLLDFKGAAARAIAVALDFSVGVKAFRISLGDVLGFVAVLGAGYLIACAIRFILREEVLSHLRLSRGIPEMISTSLYYILLLLTFLVSLSALGVQLDKLTVLTGAFGVGVGFGLQNLVNNFVSGLVLQFERPIRLGDILEVGNLSGEVRRIGIRASMVRTFQGAEVVIPNSAFISNQVINWTLSEAVRRVDLQVPVAYGTEPERVLGLLLDVATRHPETLRNPAPEAYFMGFGASTLDFVLMFWADQNTHFRLRSEIAIAVNSALRQAGIEAPLPQSEIRVRALDSSVLQWRTGAGKP